jgi:hypothetical protein
MDLLHLPRVMVSLEDEEIMHRFHHRLLHKLIDGRGALTAILSIV